MKCDVVLAQRLGCTLYAALPHDAKDAWLSANGKPIGIEDDSKDGWRCFLQYRVTNIYKDPTDWESLQASVNVLRLVVPMVCDVEVDAATAQLAVEKVLEEMKVPNEHRDQLSIERQAYKLRAMLSHLRKMMREKRSKHVHPEIMDIARLMKHVPKKNKKTKEAEEGKTKVKSEVAVTKAASSGGGNQNPSRRRPQMTSAAVQATSACDSMQSAAPLRKKRRTASDVWSVRGEPLVKMEQK